MVGKVLTVVPLLLLSGLFFAAGILQAGILFLAFAALMLWAFIRSGAGPAQLSQEEMRDIELRSSPVSGTPRRGPGEGASP